MKFKSNTILLVDDEPQILRALKQELQLLPLGESFRILTCDTTLEAETVLAENRGEIFLVIADLRMPRPNLPGSDFLLKVHNDYPDIVLILLTAYSDLPEIQKAVTAGLQALLFKPWNPEILHLEIRKARETFRLRLENRDLQERIRQQLLTAGEFQRKMLTSPEVSSQFAAAEFLYRPLPEYHCGGDYHDIIQLGDQRLLILLGDAAGHGIRPALVTAMLKVLTAQAVYGNRSPSAAEFLTELNRGLYRVLENVGDMVVTFSVLLVEPERKMLYMANAGHLPLYLRRNDVWEEIHSQGAAMGFRPDLAYEERGMELCRGDRLVLFTDGLTEVQEDQENIGGEKVREVLSAIPEEALNPGEICRRFQALHPREEFRDDVTVAVVRIL